MSNISDFGHPTGSRLGLFTAIQNIGGICALPLASYSADILGRRMGVSIGIVVVFIGIILQGWLLGIKWVLEYYLQDQMFLQEVLQACILEADS
jgi:MFS family permease